MEQSLDKKPEFKETLIYFLNNNKIKFILFAYSNLILFIFFYILKKIKKKKII